MYGGDDVRASGEADVVSNAHGQERAPLAQQQHLQYRLQQRNNDKQ